MPFPLTRRGEVMIPHSSAARLSADEAMTRLVHALERERASAISREGNVLRFKVAHMDRSSQWDILAQIDHGVLTVDDIADGVRVTYEFSHRRMLTQVTAVVLFVFGAAVIGSDTLRPELLITLALMCFLLFGIIIMISAPSFPTFLYNAIKAPP
ncbi:hypothetical protein WME99_00705 [Sorangium sp. So ce136]|uniref:hypothetical protein n=1 Tax=Sorangium sp. So ce136 TaxID=3133284 RepID=UPI003F0CD9EE